VFCPECGFENSVTSDFCAECGASLADAQTALAADSSQSSRPTRHAVTPRPVAPTPRGVHPNTGLGCCPNCGSGHLTKVRKTEENEDWQALACCTGCFLWLPALFLVPFLKTTHTDMHCCSCGHEWPA